MAHRNALTPEHPPSSDLGEHFDTLFRTSSDCLFLVEPDIEGELVYVAVNEAGQKHLPVPWHEAKGRTPLSVLGGEAGATISTRLTEVFNTGNPFSYQPIFTMAAGETVFDAVYTPVCDSAGMITGVLGVARDITLQHRLGEALTQPQRMLPHELNQPLSAVANYLHGIDGLLRRPPFETERAIGLVAAANGQIDRAREILIHMRKLAVRDTGLHDRQQVLPMLSEILPILQLNARETDAVIVLEVGSEDAVRGDRVQLQQLVVNLVRNALDAPGTGRRRHVRIQGRACAPLTYALSVSDNGPGVTPDIAPRLFEPLISSKPHGMGLGLSICQTIASAHGGRIFHSSGPEGATFTVTLNAAQVGPHDPADERHRGRGGG